jgi:mRNA interferase MazF
VTVPIRRGALVLADLDPALGSEADKIRPCIVVSNDRANLISPTLTVVPVTSNVVRIYPFQVFLPAAESKLDFDSKAQAEQIRTLDRTRLGRLLGQLGHSLMTDLEEALKLHLGLG